jgi:hypothetical protein
LIGDLFTDKVDTVWEPMASLYPADRTPIPSWDAAAGSPHHDGGNELVLPEGHRP